MTRLLHQYFFPDSMCVYSKLGIMKLKFLQSGSGSTKYNFYPMEWPPQGPEVNPIKNLLVHLSHQQNKILVKKIAALNKCNV